MHRHGIPDSRIVTMIYDDAVSSMFNPYKGQLYNEPNGDNVYANVPKDYVGRTITPQTFIAVLTGDKNAVKRKGSGRVIESGPNDRVFVYFADHGAPGFVAFPSRLHVVPTQLKAETLMKALKKMHGTGQVRSPTVLLSLSGLHPLMQHRPLPLFLSPSPPPAFPPFSSCLDDSSQTGLLDVTRQCFPTVLLAQMSPRSGRYQSPFVENSSFKK